MTPRVSIVIPAFKAANFLPELCRSIQEQTFGDFETLILDDGSNDGTQAAVAPFLPDKRFHFFEFAENRGVTSGTLELLGKIRGEFWCYPGADDILKPRFIEKRLATMDQRANVAIVHGKPAVIDEKGKALDVSRHCPPLPEVLESERFLRILLEHNVINTPSAFIRTSFTRAALSCFAGNWKYAQDWYLWILHAAAGGGAMWDSEPLNCYRVHSGSLTMRPDGAAVREAEQRLVPLCALSAAASLSPTAKEAWEHWRDPLYSLWLRRALKLRCSGELIEEWQQRAADAYYGQSSVNRSVLSEVIRHGWNVARASMADRRLRRAIPFPVAGLAEIDDPVFKAC
jgi:glycosyltransferase involved in cell wall biosynthesis